MSKLICYCWNYTDEDIKKDVFAHNGKSTIMERIKSENKAGNCQCATKNPKGKGCLSDVRRVVNEAISEMQTGRLNKKQRRTLKRIFEMPECADISWVDIESLFIALGADISEGRGSRVRVALNEVRAVIS